MLVGRAQIRGKLATPEAAPWEEPAALGPSHGFPPPLFAVIPWGKSTPAPITGAERALSPVPRRNRDFIASRSRIGLQIRESPPCSGLPRARLNSIIEGAIPTHEFSGVVMILRVMRTRCKGAVPARSRSPGNSGANTTPLDLLDGIACMDVVRFCKRLVFKALREVA